MWRSRRRRILTAAGVAALVFPYTWAATRVAEAGDGTARIVASSSTPLVGVPRLASSASTTWCGTPSQVDLAPNVIAGHPVHWLYAYASDGENRLSTFANVMQTDSESIDAWWRGQDPARTPRSDLAQFSCGPQLDISSVQLSLTAAELAVPDTPFRLVWDALRGNGFSSSSAKYVVYYDGPVGNGRTCGGASSVSTGLGMAIVYVRSCLGLGGNWVTAHELTHALGAVPSEAPHECASPNVYHVCESDRDLMYPTTDGTPLSGITLDAGRDDYYGHSGSWLDVQDSPWLVQLDRQAPLALSISGPGRVVSDVPGLDCSASCTTTWNSGTRLVLTALPGIGMKVVRWSGPCTGDADCSLVVGERPAASVLFGPEAYRLTVRVAGRGRVRAVGTAISCPRRCSASVDSYVPLRLTATANAGWRFRRWSGACTGARPTCVLPMTVDASARAIFVRK